MHYNWKCNWQMSGNDSFLSTRTSTTFTGAKSMVNTINPIFEKTAWQNFTADFSRSINLSPKFSYWEKRIQKRKPPVQNSNGKCYIARRFFFMIQKTVSQHEWEILTVWFRKGEESTSFFACPIFRFVRYIFLFDKGEIILII